ncbi:MAG: peptidoglycan DD-metalloendopeptidase family protein [Pseudomonadota bacterium]
MSCFSVYRIVLIFGVSLWTLLSSAVAQGDGQVTRDELQDLLREKAEAVAALDVLTSAEAVAANDVDALERSLISAAMESRRREEQAIDAERELVALRTQLGEARRDLVVGEVALEGLLASLAINGRSRPPAWVSHGDDANQAIRAAILMGRTVPMVQDRASGLRVRIEDMRQLQDNVTHELARLDAAEASLALKREEIARMTAAKRAAFEDVRSDAAALKSRVDLLGREAQTIESLLASLEANAPVAPRMKPKLRLAAATPNPTIRSDAPPAGLGAIANRRSQFASGTVRAPVVGRMIRGWGDKMPGGTKSEGLTFTTRGAAQVIAPQGGRVEYSGPFRTYGQLLIISTADGYHILLSGMAEAFVGVGQTVNQGEPVARMTDRALPEPELYMEIRQGGEPIDPEDWMTRG